MHPVLKYLHSPDVENLDWYKPKDENCFCLLIQAMFSPEGVEGEESFDIIVCTPKWLEKQLEQESIILGKHHLFVKKYNIDNIKSFISKFAQTCEGNSWDDVALKLSQIGKWEFFDYKE